MQELQTRGPSTKKSDRRIKRIRRFSPPLSRRSGRKDLTSVAIGKNLDDQALKNRSVAPEFLTGPSLMVRASLRSESCIESGTEKVMLCLVGKITGTVTTAFFSRGR